MSPAWANTPERQQITAAVELLDDALTLKYDHSPDEEGLEVLFLASGILTVLQDRLRTDPELVGDILRAADVFRVEFTEIEEDQP